MSQSLPNMLENTIAKIREMVDVNSVIGEPKLFALSWTSFWGSRRIGNLVTWMTKIVQTS